jgi:ribonuclease VapC
MIVDTSAIVAIVAQESDESVYRSAIADEVRSRMSVASYLECGIVVDAFGDPVLSRRLDDVLRSGDVEIVAVTEAQARTAREAYRQFGRGSGHRAK